MGIPNYRSSPISYIWLTSLVESVVVGIIYRPRHAEVSDLDSLTGVYQTVPTSQISDGDKGNKGYTIVM